MSKHLIEPRWGLSASSVIFIAEAGSDCATRQLLIVLKPQGARGRSEFR